MFNRQDIDTEDWPEPTKLLSRRNLSEALQCCAIVLCIGLAMVFLIAVVALILVLVLVGACVLPFYSIYRLCRFLWDPELEAPEPTPT